ncbi:hypothetical protein GGI35DRAFT_465408 [Trichoderma velutinum]
MTPQLTIFNLAWNMLVIAYLAITLLYLPRFYKALTAFILCVITTAIWLAIFITIVHSGFNSCSGKSIDCQCVTVAEAFIYIILAISMVLTVLKGLSIFRRPIRAIPLP